MALGGNFERETEVGCFLDLDFVESRSSAFLKKLISAIFYLLFDFHKEIFMSKEQTLSIIKPDAVGKNHIGNIISRFEQAGLNIAAAKMMHLSASQAEGFYAVHKERPFFKDLVSFMITGPVLIMVLEGEGAILKNREIMGATDPKKADKGTIRADLAETIDENAVHGSDSAENAKIEISYFFSSLEICPRTR